MSRANDQLMDRFEALLAELVLEHSVFYESALVPKAPHPVWADGFIFCWPNTQPIRVTGEVL